MDLDLYYFLLTLKNNIKEKYFLLNEPIEEEEDLFLTVYYFEETKNVLIEYEDYRNNLYGNHMISEDDFLKLDVGGFKRLLSNIYFYNCNFPIGLKPKRVNKEGERIC